MTAGLGVLPDKWKGERGTIHHRGTARSTPATQDVQITHAATCRGALEAKSPEATRTVAGGASASERPPGICVMSEFRPRQGSRRVSVYRRHTGETPRPLT